jgi:hypothetical protein
LKKRAPAVGLLRQLTASHLAKGGFAAMGFSKPTLKYMTRRREAEDTIRWLRSDGTPAFPDNQTDETDQTQKRPLTRLGLALVAAILCIGGIVFWIESEDSSSGNSAANLERKFSQERDRASVAIGGLTATRERENVALTEVESKRIANSKQRESKQDESETRSEALARELAETKQHADARQMELQEALDSSENTVLVLERENAAQKQTIDAGQMELKQALDKSEKRALALERENVAQKQTADARQMELKQALDKSEKRALALERENTAQKQTADAGQMELKQALDKSEKRALALERDNAAQKQAADARQMELKQALDESTKRALALERDNAAQKQADAGQKELKQALDKSEKRALALERDNAAQKQTADARQEELKQALDESAKRALALEHKLTSARETIASAEKPSNAEVTARDAASPTGSLNRPMELSNAASEITGSIPTPQGRANVMAGVQTSSDVMPNDVTAGASGRLTRSNRTEPGQPQSPHAMSSAEEVKLIARAEALIKQFDFANARLFLANAWEKGSARAAFMMAETYDWQILRSLQAYGVRGDAQKAREFYQMAAAAGIEKARERAEALQSDANYKEDRSR